MENSKIKLPYYHQFTDFFSEYRPKEASILCTKLKAYLKNGLMENPDLQKCRDMDDVFEFIDELQDTINKTTEYHGYILIVYHTSDGDKDNKANILPVIELLNKKGIDIIELNCSTTIDFLVKSLNERNIKEFKECYDFIQWFSGSLYGLGL